MFHSTRGLVREEFGITGGRGGSRDKRKGSQERTSPGSDNAVEDGSVGPLPCPLLTSSSVRSFTVPYPDLLVRILLLLHHHRSETERIHSENPARVLCLPRNGKEGGKRGYLFQAMLRSSRRRRTAASGRRSNSRNRRVGGASRRRLCRRWWREGEGEVSRGRLLEPRIVCHREAPINVFGTTYDERGVIAELITIVTGIDFCLSDLLHLL